MNGPMLQHRCTTGCQAWLIIAIVLGLALSAQGAGAKECHRETPLPADVRLIPPSPAVPEAVARFARAWVGEWERSGGLCHTLIVEEVLANGYARVIYRGGTSVDLDVPLPGFWRATGRIVGGALRFHEPIPEGPEFAYRVAGETLEGTFQGQAHVRLTRVADVRQVGCGATAACAPTPHGKRAATEVPGHTFAWDRVNISPGIFGGHLTMFVSADGMLYGTFRGGPDGGTDEDVGRWHITPEGQFCRMWHVWDHRRERCSAVYQGGETFEFFPKGRFGQEVYRREPGNPAGY